MRILLLEDDRAMGDSVAGGLRKEHFAVDWVETGEKGLMLGKVNDYDLGIFDIRLAGRENGIQVCHALRAYGKAFPILMLSVANEAMRKVEALTLGADDYLSKPFSFVELVARAKALLRREKRIVGPKIAAGDLSMDTLSHVVVRGGKQIALNRKEFMLLEYFMRNQGTVLTRTMILEHVWDMNADPFTNTVDVHVRFLRKKIDEPFRKKLLRTVHGYGYKLEV